MASAPPAQRLLITACRSCWWTTRYSLVTQSGRGTLPGASQRRTTRPGPVTSTWPAAKAVSSRCSVSWPGISPLPASVRRSTSPCSWSTCTCSSPTRSDSAWTSWAKSCGWRPSTPPAIRALAVNSTPAIARTPTRPKVPQPLRPGGRRRVVSMVPAMSGAAPSRASGEVMPESGIGHLPPGRRQAVDAGLTGTRRRGHYARRGPGPIDATPGHPPRTGDNRARVEVSQEDAVHAPAGGRKAQDQPAVAGADDGDVDGRRARLGRHDLPHRDCLPDPRDRQREPAGRLHPDDHGVCPHAALAVIRRADLHPPAQGAARAFPDGSEHRSVPRSGHLCG